MTVQYDRAVRCSGGPQIGLIRLRDHIKEVTGLGDMGIYNCRDTRGGSSLSIHAEGRALDIAVSVKYHLQQGNDVANALVWFSEPLQIQCVIWNRRIWSSPRASEGWRPYDGLNPHTDHIHVERNWAGSLDSRLIKDIPVPGGPAPAPVPVPPPAPRIDLQADRVRTLQRCLGVGVDGVFGPKTERACVTHTCAWNNYQRKNRRPANHIQSGPLVTFIQQQGQRRTAIPVHIDGKFGAETNHIVVVLQMKFGLVPDGVVGPKTYRVLCDG